MSQVLTNYQDQLAQAKMPAGKKMVLLTALKLFSNNGFHATTTAQLAKQAGVSEGTIYKYFRSKDEVLTALLQPVLNGIKDNFFQDLSQFKDLPSAVHFVVSDRISFVSANFDLFRLLLQSALTNQFSPDFYQQLFPEKGLAKQLTTIQHLFPEINQDLTAAQLGRIFIGPILAYILQVNLLNIPAHDRDQSLIEKQILADLTIK